MVETIGIGQLRADTCRYLNRVAEGDTLEVVRRGRLAARIEPVSAQASAGQRRRRSHTDGEVLTVQLSGFRSQASRYLDRVNSGCTIHVYHRGRALARIRSADD